MRALIASVSSVEHVTDVLHALNCQCLIARDAASFDRALMMHALNFVIVANDLPDLPFGVAVNSIIGRQRHAFICGMAATHDQRLAMIRAGADDTLPTGCTRSEIELLHARLNKMRHSSSYSSDRLVAAGPAQPQPILVVPPVQPPLVADFMAAPGEGAVIFRVGQSLEAIEIEIIRRTMEATDGNRTKAARILGISVRTLYTKLMLMERNDSGARKAAV